ncbi:uncharacterized protein LOC123587480 [Leopardus geoffroyi]|uniref:uncharacterized protein LOC123587480 n=1 Tax=Leopardus geoffroyi TaxID=46844 RepID=UPI001E25E57D|nr:uncharacterized protein LOC123587480 [Leopardus geoffroyi]
MRPEVGETSSRRRGPPVRTCCPQEEAEQKAGTNERNPKHRAFVFLKFQGQEHVSNDQSNICPQQNRESPGSATIQKTTKPPRNHLKTQHNLARLRDPLLTCHVSADSTSWEQLGTRGLCVFSSGAWSKDRATAMGIACHISMLMRTMEISEAHSNENKKRFFIQNFPLQRGSATITRVWPQLEERGQSFPVEEGMASGTH